MFIVGFNLVLSVIFIICGRQFATWTLGHVSKLNGVNDKNDGKDQFMQTIKT
jgi:hypothetical protein